MVLSPKNNRTHKHTICRLTIVLIPIETWLQSNQLTQNVREDKTLRRGGTQTHAYLEQMLVDTAHTGKEQATTSVNKLLKAEHRLL